VFGFCALATWTKFDIVRSAPTLSPTIRIFAGLFAMAAAWKSDGAVTSVFVGTAVNLLMKRLHRVFDGGFGTPHHQARRMKRAKFVLISAKECLLPTQMIVSGINQRICGICID
jgi:hypothetical protein